MKRDGFEIETPERVRLRYAPAESSTRAIAFLIDTLIQSGLAIAVVLLLIGTRAWTSGGPFLAFAILTLFAIQWGYGFFFEARTGGRTPGKSVMRIRAVREDGRPLDARTIALRNLLRGVDGLPFMILPLLGGFVTVSDPLSRRIGDLIAGTVVVKDERRVFRFPDMQIPRKGDTYPVAPDPHTKPLDERDLGTLRRFLQTWKNLPAGRQDAIAADFADRLASRIGVDRGENPAAFIESVYRAFEPCASERFCRDRRDVWLELEGILENVRKGKERLSSGSAPRFLALFRKTSGDLAAARSRALSPDLVDYLNAIVGEARAIVYSSESGSVSGLARSLARAPLALLRIPSFVIASFLLFSTPLCLSWIAASRNPISAERWSDPVLLERMAEAYSSIQFGERGGKEAAEMAAFYIANNVNIDLETLAGGALFGVGSAFFLVENGLTLGTVMGYVQAKGSGASILQFVAAHSVFELTGLVIAGAAGLLLGWNLLRAGSRSRLEAVRDSMDVFLPLAALSTLLTFGAAFIEAVFSPSAASIGARLAVAGVCLAALIAWGTAAAFRKKSDGEP